MSGNLFVGARVRRVNPGGPTPVFNRFDGYEGTVTKGYNGSFDYAVTVQWDIEGPPREHVVKDYLVLIDDTPDECEGFFV